MKLIAKLFTLSILCATLSYAQQTKPQQPVQTPNSCTATGVNGSTCNSGTCGTNVASCQGSTSGQPTCGCI
jgi:hypothetical protein